MFKYSGINSLLASTTVKCLQINYIITDDKIYQINNILFNSNLAIILQNIYFSINSLPALAILILIVYQF